MSTKHSYFTPQQRKNARNIFRNFKQIPHFEPLYKNKKLIPKLQVNYSLNSYYNKSRFVALQRLSINLQQNCIFSRKVLFLPFLPHNFPFQNQHFNSKISYIGHFCSLLCFFPPSNTISLDINSIETHCRTTDLSYYKSKYHSHRKATILFLSQQHRCLVMLRRECSVTSVLRSKTLAQGGFTSPEHIKSPLGRSAVHGAESKKDDMSKHVVFFGTPDWSRTSGLQSRSLSLYPTELRAHIKLMTLVRL